MVIGLTLNWDNYIVNDISDISFKVYIDYEESHVSSLLGRQIILGVGSSM